MSNVSYRRAKKKAEIISAAVELFNEKGFEKVALLDIAEKINMGRTTIYEYFKNKNEILAEYLEKEMSTFYEVMMNNLSDSHDLYIKLRNLLILSLDYAKQHLGFQQLYQVLFKNSSDVAVQTKAKLVKQHRELYAAMAGAINKDIENKKIKKMNADIFVQIFFNMLYMPVKTGKSIEQTADEILSYLWEGISI